MAPVTLTRPSERVALVSLANPPRNVLTWALNEALEAALRDARDGGAEVVVLASAVDGCFVAHGDLADNVETFTGGTPSGDPTAGLRVQKELDTGPMVSIAAIDGQAWGGGAELAWACDLRVATARASFGQPEARLGVTTVGGSARLAHLVGEAVAKRLVLDARPIDGEEAHRLGLVQRLAAPGRATEEALTWASWLASHPPGTLARAKAVFTGHRGEDLRGALAAELRAYVESFSRAEAIDRARAAQAAYDEGADSPTVFGLE